MNIMTIYFFGTYLNSPNQLVITYKREREGGREPTYHIHHIDQETKHPNKSIWQEQPNIRLMKINHKRNNFIPLKKSSNQSLIGGTYERKQEKSYIS